MYKTCSVVMHQLRVCTSGVSTIATGWFAYFLLSTGQLLAMCHTCPWYRLLFSLTLNSKTNTSSALGSVI